MGSGKICLLVIYVLCGLISLGSLCLSRNKKDMGGTMTESEQAIQLAEQLGRFLSPVDLQASNIYIHSKGGNKEEIASSFYNGAGSPTRVKAPIRFSTDVVGVPEEGVIIRVYTAPVAFTNANIEMKISLEKKNAFNFKVVGTKDSSSTSSSSVLEINGCNFLTPVPLSGHLALVQFKGVEDLNEYLQFVTKNEITTFKVFTCTRSSPFHPEYTIITSNSQVGNKLADMKNVIIIINM